MIWMFWSSRPFAASLWKMAYGQTHVDKKCTSWLPARFSDSLVPCPRWGWHLLQSPAGETTSFAIRGAWPLPCWASNSSQNKLCDNCSKFNLRQTDDADTTISIAASSTWGKQTMQIPQLTTIRSKHTLHTLEHQQGNSISTWSDSSACTYARNIL